MTPLSLRSVVLASSLAIMFVVIGPQLAAGAASAVVVPSSGTSNGGAVVPTSEQQNPSANPQASPQGQGGLAAKWDAFLQRAYLRHYDAELGKQFAARRRERVVTKFDCHDAATRVGHRCDVELTESLQPAAR